MESNHVRENIQASETHLSSHLLQNAITYVSESVCGLCTIIPLQAKVNTHVAGAVGGLVGIYMWHGWYLQALGWNVRLERSAVQIVHCARSLLLYSSSVQKQKTL